MANQPTMGRLAGTGYLVTPISHVRGFSFFVFFESLGINIERYEGLVHCTRLFIQICRHSVNDKQSNANANANAKQC